MNKQFNEAPSLTMLYGESIGPEIMRAARKYGVRPADVAAVIESRPELMGVGEGFANVFQAISKGVGEAAPGIGAAITAMRSGKPIAATPAPAPVVSQGMINTPFGPISPLMLAIPAAGILGFILIKQMKKADKRRK